VAAHDGHEGCRVDWRGDGRFAPAGLHRAILAISTAFWEAWLAGNADARTWLNGAAPRTVLEPADEWQRK